MLFLFQLIINIYLFDYEWFLTVAELSFGSDSICKNCHNCVMHMCAGSPQDGVEEQAILVNAVNRDGTKKYRTTFLMADEEGGEYELVYFRSLDREFNKVDKFYKAKVEEVVKEASVLNKQMNALIAFRIKVENPEGVWDFSGDRRAEEITRLATDIAVSTAALSSSTPSGVRASSKSFN